MTTDHLALLNVQFMLDFLGLVLADKVTSSVAHCYKVVKVRTIFTTKTAFHSIHRDVLPIFQQSNSINKFQCYCNATYIGRTS